MFLIQILPFQSISTIRFPKYNHITSLPENLETSLPQKCILEQNYTSLKTWPHYESNLTNHPFFDPQILLDSRNLDPPISCFCKCCKHQHVLSLSSSSRLNLLITSFLKILLMSPCGAVIPSSALTQIFRNISITRSHFPYNTVFLIPSWIPPGQSFYSSVILSIEQRRYSMFNRSLYQHQALGI